MRRSSGWCGALALLALAGPAAAQSGDWTTYGGNDWNQRYSQLKTISTSNVGQLVPRMIFQTGIARLGSFENTPIVQNGIMYVTTPYNTAMAYDLNTKKELWRYEHKLGTTIYCCGPNNRGVAIHGGAHVYMGTLDARLVALDAKAGKVLWDKEVADPAFGYSITHAPLIIGDNVIVGVSGGEYGIRGHVTAYNAATGEQVWRWYSIPAPQGDPTFDDKAPNGWWGTWRGSTPDGANLNRDIAKERADSAQYADAWTRGGGGVWMTPAYDKESNTIFVAVGNPSPDLDGSVRPGDNLYTDCVVAIDATSGKTKWYYQTVPHDVWDLDAVSPPVVVNVDGKRAVVHAGKTGWVYVLEAATGKLIRRSDAFVPQENMSRRRTCSPCRPPREPGCCRAPTAGPSGRRSRSIRTWATPWSPRCTSRCTTRCTTRPGRRAASGLAPPSWRFRARSSTASSRRSTSRPARSPGRTRSRSP
jgi:alcohol dehydrogenase (cytochrome c)